MNSKQMQAETKRINRQLRQLRRRFVWNYDRIIELEKRLEELKRELPAATAQDQARAQFVKTLFSN